MFTVGCFENGNSVGYKIDYRFIDVEHLRNELIEEKDSAMQGAMHVMTQAESVVISDFSPKFYFSQTKYGTDHIVDLYFMKNR